MPSLERKSLAMYGDHPSSKDTSFTLFSSFLTLRICLNELISSLCEEIFSLDMWFSQRSNRANQKLKNKTEYIFAVSLSLFSFIAKISLTNACSYVVYTIIIKIKGR